MKTKSEFSQVARKAFWIPENERESIETIELAKFHRQFANCPVLLVHFETGLIYAAGPSEQSIELLFEENLSLPLEQFVFGPGSIDLRVEGDEDYEIKPPA